MKTILKSKINLIRKTAMRYVQFRFVFGATKLMRLQLRNTAKYDFLSVLISGPGDVIWRYQNNSLHSSFRYTSTQKNK
jgi:hypothetical protein